MSLHHLIVLSPRSFAYAIAFYAAHTHARGTHTARVRVLSLGFVFFFVCPKYTPLECRPIILWLLNYMYC